MFRAAPKSTATSNRDKMALENVGFKMFLRRNKEKAEIRRINIRECFLNNFEYLQTQIVKLFPELSGIKFSIFWNDGEDEIKISSDEELILALSCIQGNLKKLYIEIIPPNPRKLLKVAFSLSSPKVMDSTLRNVSFTMTKKDEHFIETKNKIKELLMKHMALNNITIQAPMTSSAGRARSDSLKPSAVVARVAMNSAIAARNSSSSTLNGSINEVSIEGKKLDKLSDLVYELAKITRSLSLRCPCESHQVEDKPTTPEEVVPKVMSLNESIVALRFVLDNVYLLKDKFFSPKKTNLCMQLDSSVKSSGMEPENSEMEKSRNYFQLGQSTPKDFFAELKAKNAPFPLKKATILPGMSVKDFSQTKSTHFPEKTTKDLPQGKDLPEMSAKDLTKMTPKDVPELAAKCLSLMKSKDLTKITATDLPQTTAKDTELPEMKAKGSISKSPNVSNDSGEGSESESADIPADVDGATQDADIVDCSSVKTISESSEGIEERWTLLYNDDMHLEQEIPVKGQKKTEEQSGDFTEFESHVGCQSEGGDNAKNADGINPKLPMKQITDIITAPVTPAPKPEDIPVSNLEMRGIFPHIADALGTLEQMGFDIKDSKILFLTELYDGNVEAVVELLLKKN